MPILSCIGAGRVGKTLCYLLSKQLRIGQIINPSIASGRKAVDFIGSGEATTINALKKADIWLIATPDKDIEWAAKQLLAADVLQPDNIVFHCSGLLPSSILHNQSEGLNVASVHPIHSFADPQLSIDSFSGTYCAIEGSEKAVDRLTKLFSFLGALPFAINSQHKDLYHAATVMACNYLVSLLHISDQMMHKAGVDEAQTSRPLEPLIRQTMENYLSLGGKQALTGPIARGDVQTVEKHLMALDKQPDSGIWKQLYTALGQATLPLAAAQQTPVEYLNSIAKLLDASGTYEK